MNYAYLRVSTLEQDELNQRQGVDLKAKRLGLTIDEYIVDKVSGTKEPADRNLGKLLNKVHEGDMIFISELSRFGRRTFMLFRIFEYLLKKGVKVYSSKEDFTLENSIQSKVMIFGFGLAAEIERDLISARTKEALAYRKSQGVILGRPIGSKTKIHKLDKFKDKITYWLKKKVSKSKIAKKCKVCDKTLRKYIIKYNLDKF